MSEIGYFPRPLKDELLYSIIARLQTQAIYDSPGQLSLDLFGKRHIPATIDLPSHIYILSKRLQSILPFTDEEIIDRFTLWPYYRKFIVNEKRNRALKLMKGNDGTGLHTLIGISASAMARNRGIRYCPGCAIEDKSTTGLYYWHRVHQIPDLWLCPVHKYPLETYTPNETQVQRSVYIDANEVIRDIPAAITETNDMLIKLAILASDILQNTSSFDINEVHYRSILQNTAFARGSNQISEEFTRSFISYYSANLVEKILPGTGHGWIKAITYRPLHFFHPIRHLMMTLFLSQIPKIKSDRKSDTGPTDEKPLRVATNVDLQTHRKKWTALLCRFETNKVLSARKQNPALYVWLYRYDYTWLLSTNKANHVDETSQEFRLDWRSLDEKVLDLIIQTIERLKSTNYRGRITKSLIAKIIQGQHYLLGKNANKFPKSLSYLNDHIESNDLFHQRRILTAIDELRIAGSLKRWQVMRRAGLGQNVSSKAIKTLDNHFRYVS